MAKRLNAQEVADYWIQFVNQYLNQNKPWAKHWNTNTDWTNFILGTKASSTEDSPFGNYLIAQKLPIQYRTEDGSFDMGLYFNLGLGELPTHDRNFLQIPFVDKYYPWVYDILFEHENEIYYCWHEMIKLVYVRAYVKMVVTYYTDFVKPNEKEAERNLILKTASMIIQKCNAEFPEHPHTEYLILIGEKVEDKLYWDTLILDSLGNLTTLKQGY